MKKNILLYMSMIILMICITGCTILKPKFSGLSEQGIKYLENKYDTKCEYLEARPGNDGFSNDYRYDYFSCKDLIEKSILVETTKIGDEQYTFIDNYYILKYENEVRSILSSSINNLWSKAQLFYNVDGFNMNSARNTLSKVQNISSFEDYLSKADIYYNIAIKFSNYTNRQQVTNELKSHFNSIRNRISNINLRFEIIKDDDFSLYNGDTFERSYGGSGVGVADYVEFADISFDNDLNCYALYWYCWECSVERTEKVCLNK